ncbi:hypothetical protein ACTG25_23790 [Aeromonas sp. 80P]
MLKAMTILPTQMAARIRVGYRLSNMMVVSSFQGKDLISRLEASYGENKLKTWQEAKGEASGEPIHTGLTRFSWINSWNGIEGVNLPVAQIGSVRR